MSQINYLAVDALQRKIENVKRNFYNLQRVHLCIYNINLSGQEPFIEYLLYKYNSTYNNKYKNTLCFPFFEYKNEYGGDDDILEKCNDRMSKIVGHLGIEYTYKGYLYDSNEMYVFFNIQLFSKILSIGEMALSLNNFTNDDEYILSTIYEIVNLKSVLNYKILSHVVLFFYNYTDFIDIFDEKMKKYETPIVMYNGYSTDHVNYRLFMGSSRMSSMALFGPYYYYSCLNNAIVYGVWDNYIKEKSNLYSNKYGKYKNGSLLRYAIFERKKNVRMNNKTDVIDNSLTTTQMIKENSRIKKTQKISDRDGLWTSEYDSIYVGKHKDFKGEMLAIKNSNNATLLSVHKLNMQKFPEKKESYDSSILNEILIE